ncbi:MAG: Gfo/Idh/MocA family protein [Paracoccaceae bacterium]
MIKPLGIGLIGCGVISEIYLKRCQTFPQIEMRAVSDLMPAAAKAKAEANDVPAVTPEELLQRDDIDIVLNLTVPAAHVEIGLASIAAGKHVYSEKPFGSSVAEATKLIVAAKAAGLRVGCAPDTFLGGSHQAARAILDSGKIGHPVAGTATLMLAGHERWHPNPDFYYSLPGGGPVMDMAPYYLSTMINFLGPVKRVSAMGARPQDDRVIATGPRAGERVPVQVLTHVAGVMEFDSGAIVQIVTSFDVKGHRHSPLEIYGSEGSMIIPDPNRYGGDVELLEDGEWVAQPLDHAHGDDDYRGIGLADMAEAIVQGRPHRASGEFALHVQEVIEALIGSAESGDRVDLVTRCERPAPIAAGGALGVLS